MSIKFVLSGKTHLMLKYKQKLDLHAFVNQLFPTPFDFLLIYYLYFVVFCTHKHAAILNN